MLHLTVAHNVPHCFLLQYLLRLALYRVFDLILVYEEMTGLDAESALYFLVEIMVCMNFFRLKNTFKIITAILLVKVLDVSLILSRI